VKINEDVKPRIFLTNGFDMYALLSLSVGRNSFGKSDAALPTDNVFIKKPIPRRIWFSEAARKITSEV